MSQSTKKTNRIQKGRGLSATLNRVLPSTYQFSRQTSAYFRSPLTVRLRLCGDEIKRRLTG